MTLLLLLLSLQSRAWVPIPSRGIRNNRAHPPSSWFPASTSPFFMTSSSNNSNDGESKESSTSEASASSSAKDATPAAATVILLEEDEEENKNNEDEDDPCATIKQQAQQKQQDEYTRLIQVEIDLEREKTRMESFEEYVLVAVLTASASFGILTEIEVSNALWQNPLSVAAIGCAGMSTLCGLHATVVFSLSALYGKSCLGKKRDDEYQYLLQELIPQRQRAFQSFSGSLLLFSMEVGLLLYQAMPASSGMFRGVAALASTGMLTMIFADWKTIVDKAKIIYVGDIPMDDEDDE
eukprot:CAMPEP_0172457094 /NCGR_PEP_ID=MMETSP1065-20121228/19883_1 /TAXON_ID=265537 /ORGANISM="Amphiprora paludosa, Strain CCMP125" /LENGTH=294 /DNA_ID=CAMNT_0013210591 /DNA_START=99 /DNA_END=983 /DNA_ORIENTATION=+